MELDEKSYIEIPDESLLLRYITGEVTQEENLRVKEWSRKDIANEELLIQLARIYYAQRTQQRIKNRDAEAAFRIVNNKIKKKGRRLFLQRVGVAASLIIGILGIGSFIFQYSDLRESFLPSMITVESNDNSRTRLVLPDGTEVCLNSGSSITYPSRYTDSERNVTLSGEAYFKVTHNKEKPFIVNALNKKYKVKVLGTEFNMQAYRDDNVIQTTLIIGSVQVDIQGKNTKTVLLPSQKAIYSVQNNELEVVTANTDRETDWMYSRLVFKKTPMPEVLARLSRFYKVEFDVRNKIIDTYTFTGTFEDKPLYQVLDYMKISSQIDYNITYQKDEKGTKSVVVLRR